MTNACEQISLHESHYIIRKQWMQDWKAVIFTMKVKEASIQNTVNSNNLDNICTNIINKMSLKDVYNISCSYSLLYDQW